MSTEKCINLHEDKTHCVKFGMMKCRDDQTCNDYKTTTDSVSAVHELVSHTMSKEDVEMFALRGGHALLYECIQRYKASSDVTWEQAMQAAAVLQSTNVAETRQMVVDLIKRTPNLQPIMKG